MKKLLLFLIFISNLAHAQTLLTRGPYLQKASSSSIVIRWRTDKQTDSVLSYGSELGKLKEKVINNELSTEHSLEINKLSPNTKYYYAIGSSTEKLTEANSENYFITSPNNLSEEKVRIWAIGDSGRGNQAQIDVYNSYLKYPKANVWLMLGDNAYETGKDEEYQKGLFNIYANTLKNTVLWPTFGNHDGYSADSNKLTGPYYDIFSLPQNAEAGGMASNTEAYYSFDYGPVHFISLNSFDIDKKPNSKMATWLKEDLKKSRSKWKIAFWHHPAYSKSFHDSDKEIEMIEMRKYIAPIIEKAGVDLVLSGHSHNYERSHLIHGHYENSSSFSESMIVDKNYNKKNIGTVYLVAGSGSSLHDGEFNHPAIAKHFKNLGSLLIEIDKNKLETKFINEKAEVIDSFIIKKSPLRALLPPRPPRY